MKNEQQWRDGVLRRLERLADQKANDAVKLAFLSQEQVGEIDRMDLSALTELKRHGNGAVEIKLVDRVLALDKLCEISKRSGEGAQSLLHALERSVEQDGDPDPAGQEGEAE